MSKRYEHTNIDCMVDLETLGVGDGSPIVTIGAVLFDPRKQDDVKVLQERSFLRRVDLSDAIRNSRGIEPDTLKWWFQQKDAAIKALVEGETVTLKQALQDFRNYCIDRAEKLDQRFFDGFSKFPPACRLWAKGPDFDAKILEAACKAVDESMPMRFFQYRCVRTIQDLAWPNGPDDHPEFDVGTAHAADDDAVSQALMVQAGHKELGLSTDVEFSTY